MLARNCEVSNHERGGTGHCDVQAKQLANTRNTFLVPHHRHPFVILIIIISILTTIITVIHKETHRTRAVNAYSMVML